MRGADDAATHPRVLGGTMRARTAISTVAAALLLLAGCSGSDDGKPAAKPTTAKPTASNKPSPTPTDDPSLKMGKAFEWEDTTNGVSGTVTVLGYEQGIKSHVTAEKAGVPEGTVWATLEVKSCSTGGTFSATFDPWTLAYKDDTRATPAGFYPVDLPRPEYVNGTTLTDGKCLRGKIGFLVPGDARPATVVYAPAAMTSLEEWAVPAED